MNDDRTSRLENLDKLRLIPAMGIRDLLLSKLDGKDGSRSRIGRLTREQLIEEVDQSPAVCESDIEKAFDEHRYGRRLSFQIYLLPKTVAASDDLDAMKASLSDLLSKTTATESGEASTSSDEYESDEFIQEIEICDIVRFDDTLEIRYKYLVQHSYLSIEEKTEYVYQVRYGFVWRCIDGGYLALLCNDSAVTKPLLSALARELQCNPIPVTLHPDIVDQHFDPDRAMRFNHLDPQTHVRQSISGSAEGLGQFHNEIAQRNSRYQRPGTLYHEDIMDGRSSGLGVVTSKGKLYLTKIVPASVVRLWARSRIGALVVDLRKRSEFHSDSAVRASPVIANLRTIAADGKLYVATVIDLLLHMKRNALLSMPFEIDPITLYEALGNAYLTPLIYCECASCSDQESARRCPWCDGDELVLSSGHIHCRSCSREVSHDGEVTLKCVHGHVATAPMREVFAFVPKGKFKDVVRKVLDRINIPWSREREAFFIKAGTLYYLEEEVGESQLTVNGDVVVAQVGDEGQGVIVGTKILTGDGKMAKDQNRPEHVGGDSISATVGDHNTGVAVGKNINQIWNEKQKDLDLPTLAGELSTLRMTMKETAVEPEHDIAVGEVAAAESAAKGGDGPTALQHLKNAGQWALDIAVRLAVPVATEAIKSALQAHGVG